MYNQSYQPFRVIFTYLTLIWPPKVTQGQYKYPKSKAIQRWWYSSGLMKCLRWTVYEIWAYLWLQYANSPSTPMLNIVTLKSDLFCISIKIILWYVLSVIIKKHSAKLETRVKNSFWEKQFSINLPSDSMLNLSIFEKNRVHTKFCYSLIVQNLSGPIFFLSENIPGVLKHILTRRWAKSDKKSFSIYFLSDPKIYTQKWNTSSESMGILQFGLLGYC